MWNSLWLYRNKSRVVLTPSANWGRSSIAIRCLPEIVRPTLKIPRRPHPPSGAECVSAPMAADNRRHEPVRQKKDAVGGPSVARTRACTHTQRNRCGESTRSVGTGPCRNMYSENLSAHLPAPPPEGDLVKDRYKYRRKTTRFSQLTASASHLSSFKMAASYCTCLCRR